jgi:hypothetical protein
MPKYFVRFDVVESWKGTFDADNLDHAKELLKAVIEGDENFDDLASAESRNSGITVEVYEDSLEQVF